VLSADNNQMKHHEFSFVFHWRVCGRWNRRNDVTSNLLLRVLFLSPISFCSVSCFFSHTNYSDL